MPGHAAGWHRSGLVAKCPHFACKFAWSIPFDVSSKRRSRIKCKNQLKCKAEKQLDFLCRLYVFQCLYRLTRPAVIYIFICIHFSNLFHSQPETDRLIHQEDHVGGVPVLVTTCTWAAKNSSSSRHCLREAGVAWNDVHNFEYQVLR